MRGQRLVNKMIISTRLVSIELPIGRPYRNPQVVFAPKEGVKQKTEVIVTGPACWLRHQGSDSAAGYHGTL